MKLTFNLERIIGIILLFAISIWGVKQCSIKRVYKKQFESQEKIVDNFKNEKAILLKTYSQAIDSINYFQERNIVLQNQLKSRNAKISKIESIYDTLIQKWNSNTTLDRKRFLDSLFEATGGQDVYFDSLQVYDMGTAIIKGNECLMVKPELEFQIQTLNAEIDNCNQGYENEQKVINSLTKISNDLKVSNEDLMVKNKILKRKNLWKTVYGVGITGLAVLIAL